MTEESLREYDERRADENEVAAEQLPRAEAALTQIQHIAHDGCLAFDAESGKRGPLSDFEKHMEATMQHIASVAETGEADPDFAAALNRLGVDEELDKWRCPQCLSEEVAALPGRAAVNLRCGNCGELFDRGDAFIRVGDLPRAASF